MRRRLAGVLLLLSAGTMLFLALRDPPKGAAPGAVPISTSQRDAVSPREEEPSLSGEPAEVPSGALVGVVRDEAGRPVARARVRLLVPDKSDDILDAMTDERGLFRFLETASGRGELTVTATGVLSPVSLVVSLPTPEPLIVTIPRGLDIAGRVIDSAGGPLPGVSVGVSPLDAVGRASPIYLGSVRSDALGGFTLRGLRPGRYRLAPSRSDLRFEQAEPLLAGTDDAVLYAAATRAVAGRALDPDGRPLPDATIHATPIGPLPVAVTPHFVRGVAQTDAEGRFRFGWLPSTELRLTATHADFDPLPDVVITGDREDLEFWFRVSRLVISGTVERHDGTPVAKAFVEASPVGKGKARVVRTDDDGKFEFRGLTPGRYRLAAGTAGVEGRLEDVEAGMSGVTVVIDPR